MLFDEPAFVARVKEHTIIALNNYRKGITLPIPGKSLLVPCPEIKASIILHFPDSQRQALLDGGEPAMAEWLKKIETGDVNVAVLGNPEEITAAVKEAMKG